MALIGTFGALVFETSGFRVHTFSDLRVSTENRFAQHDVHLETPILEYVGPGLTDVVFSMNFNKQWGSDPIASLLILRTYLKARVLLALARWHAAGDARLQFVCLHQRQRRPSLF